MAGRCSAAAAAAQLVVALLLVANAAAVAAADDGASIAGTCAVSSWSGFTPCARMGVYQWAHTHSRSVVAPGSDCPALVETLACDAAAGRPPKPADAAAATQHATSGLLVALPLALSSSLTWPQDAPVGSNMTVTGDLIAGLQAGRQLWQQQASSLDLTMCTPFNGVGQLLTDATPIVGDQGRPKAADRAMERARAAFAAVAQATALQSAAQYRATGGRSSSSADRVLAPFRQAAASPAADGVLPPPSVDATAAVSWDGSSSMAVSVKPGSSMSSGALSLANLALLDGMKGLVPWLAIQTAKPQGGAEAATATVMQLDVSYDSAQQAATFTSVADAAQQSGVASHGHLLLPITPHLARMFGLAFTPAGKAALLTLPSTGAVLKTSAGGGVTQMALSLAGAWSPANLTAAFGVQGSQLSVGAGAAQGTFTILDPTLLFNSAPSALYIAMTTTVPSLAVDGAPATLNVRPGGSAALTLFEPCEPVSGLQLSDVVLHMGADGNMTGSAAGSLASTAVSAVAMLAPSSNTQRAAGDALSLVMTAETVAAGSLADVITIITHKPPARLLAQLRQDQQQGTPMQFSSVTLTYSHPRKVRRERGGGSSKEDAEGTGFDMVAVPDVEAAPALKQMLDAIGLNGDSLALRAGGAASRGAAFALAAAEPFRLQLPAPFSNPGPTMLSLDVSGAGSSSNRAGPAPPVLQGSMAAQVGLPGAVAVTALDLGSVAVTTPTTVVGVQAGAAAEVPVTAQVSGRTVSKVELAGFSFLSFQALDVSAAAGFRPAKLLSLNMSGPVSAFGVAGRAIFNTTTNYGRRDASDAPSGGMAFVGRLPVVDVPLMARSLGVSVPLGALGAQLRSARVAFPSSARTAGAPPSVAQQDGGSAMDVNAELQMCGMASPVSFALSADQASSFSALFVPMQINRALMPGIAAGVTAALQTAQRAVTAARAAAGSRVALAAQLDEARAELDKAKQQAAAANAAFESARQQAASTLGGAAVFAESAAVAFHDARGQAGSALQAARSEFNRADAAFNQAKTLAYQTLNMAKQAYSDALTKHEAAVSTAQLRVDGLLNQASRLRVAYNTANSRCNPAPAAQAQCRAAAAAWSEYRAVAANLDVAQTALQEVATTSASAQQLRAALAEFLARQSAAEDVLTGAEWTARSDAAGQLDAALQAMAAADSGPVATQLQTAQASLEQAQQGMSSVLTPAGTALQALAGARGAVRAAVAGVKATTAAASLSADDLAAAARDLGEALAAMSAPQSGGEVDAAAAAAAPGALFKMDRISVGFSLARNAPLMLGVSYSGSVAAPDGARLLSGRFQVDMSSSGDDLSVMLIDLLRDDVLAAVRTSRRSLSSLL